MLSSIIPAHNEERWIGKCLHSIRTTMEQVREPYEVIVVDDASTDSTQQIAQQMGLGSFVWTTRSGFQETIERG